MNRFTGDRSIGPFWKLLEVAEQVGWCVEVPGFYDHDGCWISLLDTTEGILRGVAEEAWSQFVAKEISKRKDFEDLRGIDLAVFRQSQRRLDGKTRAFLQPIQDGSFLDSKAQSKFDMAKERNCSRCGVEDTHEHRCFHCVKFTSVHARHREIIDTTLRMQSSLRAHLLPSRNPEWRGFKHFLNTPEMVERRAWVAAS